MFSDQTVNVIFRRHGLLRPTFTVYADGRAIAFLRWRKGKHPHRIVADISKKKLYFTYPLLSGRQAKVKIREDGRILASGQFGIGRRIVVKFIEGMEVTFLPRGIWRQTFVLESPDAKVSAVWNPLNFSEPFHVRTYGLDITSDESTLVAFLLLFYLCWIHFP